MTQDTKIILRELAIIHTALKVLMEQQEAIANRVLEPSEKTKFPRLIRKPKPHKPVFFPVSAFFDFER